MLFIIMNYCGARSKVRQATRIEQLSKSKLKELLEV